MTTKSLKIVECDWCTRVVDDPPRDEYGEEWMRTAYGDYCPNCQTLALRTVTNWREVPTTLQVWATEKYARNRAGQEESTGG